jgi:hypothetical protein
MGSTTEQHRHEVIHTLQDYDWQLDAENMSTDNVLTDASFTKMLLRNPHIMQYMAHYCYKLYLTDAEKPLLVGEYGNPILPMVLGKLHNKLYPVDKIQGMYVSKDLESPFFLDNQAHNLYSPNTILWNLLLNAQDAFSLCNLIRNLKIQESLTIRIILLVSQESALTALFKELEEADLFIRPSIDVYVTYNQETNMYI